ncbi:hypothetical protein [Tenggerimyces flavus]|uniref:Uncharacterized protein n=1 Tax=Tenggerimyces flavus TaxID=1708749 RepID=A0ABV7YFK8_9ACTN|nr:hypothetical protein [Tenggerimyces flavus]MBM7786013.1 hypothetical protein [Tenggerimyces flavus]
MSRYALVWYPNRASRTHVVDQESGKLLCGRTRTAAFLNAEEAARRGFDLAASPTCKRCRDQQAKLLEQDGVARPSALQRIVAALRRHPVRTALVAVGSGLVALATIVGTSITVADYVAKNDTSPLSLHLAPFSVDYPLVTYVLPFDAPIETFPAGEDSYCSPERLEWLRAHGASRLTKYGVELRNDAKDGAQLSVRNLRAQGTSTPVSEPVLLVDCEFGGGIADSVALTLDLDSRRPAVESRSNRPFAFNLAPGETGSLLITTEGLQDFAGKVTVEATVEGETRSYDVPMSPDSGTSLSIPASGLATIQHATMRKTSGQFSCWTEGKGKPAPALCDATEVRLRVARAWGRTDLVDKLLVDNPFRVPGRQRRRRGVRGRPALQRL